MIKLVIFDFDDTLSFTEETFFHVENQIAGRMGFAPMTRERHKANWGQPLQKAITERIPGIDADSFMEMHEKVIKELLKDTPIDQISERNIDILKKLKNDGKRLAILTSRTLKEAEHLLDESHHLNKYIEKIYHADNSDFLKPDPRVFDKVLQEFKTFPQAALYVGDSPGDAVSAKGAGIHFIALLENGIRSKEDFKSLGVDHFAGTLSEIFNYLERE